MSIITSLLTFVLTSVWESVQRQRALAKEYKERKPRLVFAMSAHTPGGHPLVKLDMAIQEEPVV